MPFHEFITSNIVLSSELLLAVIVLIAGIILGYIINRVNRLILERAGIPELVEGTAFERTMQSVGSSTTSLIASLSMWFVIGVTVLAVLAVIDFRVTQQFWTRVTGFLPQIFIAILILIVGIVVGDKTELVIRERLKGVKLPQMGVVPKLAKYSIVFIAIILALSQIGVATNALLVLLIVYVVAIVFLGGIAFKDLLMSGAAGMYLLLNQPYAIGDEIQIGDRRGIVQEIDMFVTRIENENTELVIPNRFVFDRGVIKTLRE